MRMVHGTSKTWTLSFLVLFLGLRPHSAWANDIDSSALGVAHGGFSSDLGHLENGGSWFSSLSSSTSSLSSSAHASSLQSGAASPLDLYRNKYSAEGPENYLPVKLHTVGDASDMYRGSLPPLILGSDGPYMGPPPIEHYRLQPRTTNYFGPQDIAGRPLSAVSGLAKEPAQLFGAAEVMHPFSQYSNAFNVTSGTSTVSVGAAPGIASREQSPGFPNYSQFGGGIRRLFP